MKMSDVTAFLNSEVINISGAPLTVGQILLVPLVIILGLLLMSWLGGVIRRRMSAKEINPDLIQLVGRVFYVFAIAGLVITSLDLLNVPLTAFAFVSGAVAIGVGFGAQNIINNFISGWILMWERPIKINDFLEIGDMRGRVESINTRSTRIRRVDGVHLLIPNSHLLENIVVNWNLVDQLTRTQVRVGVAYGSPVKTVKALIGQAVQEQEAILTDPAPLIVFEDFGDSALIFEAYIWVNASADKDLRVIRSDVRFRIDELFAENGIVIAFPQRDVHLDGQITLHKADSHHNP
ncbi:MAG: mechanosensitive ion channel family protein [bacterium]